MPKVSAARLARLVEQASTALPAPDPRLGRIGRFARVEAAYLRDLTTRRHGRPIASADRPAVDTTERAA
jgi:hypothetical protein